MQQTQTEVMAGDVCIGLEGADMLQPATEEIWTDQELEVIRRLTEKNDLTVMGILRQGLRLYQLVQEGHAVVIARESPGCGVVE